MKAVTPMEGWLEVSDVEPFLGSRAVFAVMSEVVKLPSGMFGVGWTPRFGDEIFGSGILGGRHVIIRPAYNHEPI